jgi:tetratricopeptide (TPR) repeat protein
LEVDADSWSRRCLDCFDPILRIVLGLAFCIVAELAWADSPTAYGDSFIRLDHVPPVQQTATADVPDGQADAASYQRQLERFEQAEGPYAATLAEPLAGIARLHQQQGDIAQAQHHYERALHIVRVNEGLYSERQIPILRQLFASYRQVGDMQTLDARYDYYFRLYGSGQPPFTAVRLAAALEYMRWQREALLLGLDGESSRRLLELYELNARLLEGVGEPDAETYEAYRLLVLSQLYNLYLLQHSYRPEQQGWNELPHTLGAAGWDQQDTREHRLDMIQRTALSRGRSLLEGLIAATPPEQTITLAEVYLELGDWNQWNDQRGAAQTAYEQVQDMLGQAGETQLLEQWLGAPAELPANGAFGRRLLPADQGDSLARASFSVSARGKPSAIEVSTAGEVSDGRLWRFRRDLAGTRFRPRYSAGQAAATEGLVREYRLL